MENKQMDNKKLSRILFMSGFGLLILFIIVRLVFKAQGEKVTDMPVVGELSYNPKKIKEKSKMQQFEDQRIEKQRKEMGYEENNYIVPDFNNMTNKYEKPVESIPVKNENVTHQNSKRENYPLTEMTTKAHSKLKYESAYFPVKMEAAPVQEKNIPPTKKNPFGTISGESNSQKSSLNTVSESFYRAEIYGDQKIENGGIVLIRNTEALQFTSVTIPKNSILYGQAAFNGNRVNIKINRAKTSSGEYALSLCVLDNDRLQGIYYKAPIDETIDKTKEDADLPQIPGKYGGVINSISQTMIGSGKELMKRKTTLNLEEGYKLFITALKQN